MKRCMGSNGSYSLLKINIRKKTSGNDAERVGQDIGREGQDRTSVRTRDVWTPVNSAHILFAACKQGTGFLMISSMGH